MKKKIPARKPAAKPAARKPPAKAAAAPAGLACLILAAGKGTRMKSSRAKVLHTVLGAPLVVYSIERARELGADPVVAILGHQRADVERALVDRYGADGITVVEQAEQRGTGHAVMLGLAPLDGWDGLVLILCGDTPLLRRETLEALVAEARKTGGLALLTARVPDPTGYGRIVRDGRKRVQRIVEHKDATAAQRRITEVNSGVYVAPAAFLREATARLRTTNAQGEYYLTDVVAHAARSIGATAVDMEAAEMAGINDRRQLVEAEEVLRRRMIARWQDQVTFRDPAGTVVEPGVELGADVELGRGVALRGTTRVAAGARIDDGAILTDCVVGEGAEVRPYTVATGAVIGAGAKVGPFSHLRPGTELGPEAHVGNFVETKQTRLGRGSKANHLTYLGDAVIGDGVNVGAGTITCNYNGYEKRTTVIEDGAFIGSDTQLVAPVRVGQGAIVAAGTTVTKDVPAGALAITRVEQEHVGDYARRLAERYGAADEAAAPGGHGGSGVSESPQSVSYRKAR